MFNMYLHLCVCPPWNFNNGMKNILKAVRHIALLLLCRMMTSLSGWLCYSPLLHLHIWVHHERERCICPLSFLWKKENRVKPYYTKQKSVGIFTSSRQLLHSKKSLKELFPTNNQTSSFKEPCLLKNTLYSWVFGLPLSSTLKLMSAVGLNPSNCWSAH